MEATYQNLSLAELINAKCELEARKAKMRVATACYEARKRAESLGKSVEEYLTTPRERKSGKARKITWEVYRAWEAKRNNN